MVKDWFNDPCYNYKKKVDMKKILKVEASLVGGNYDLIEEVEYFGQLHLDDG
jgi:hypothetical protein